jgi:hypothetical protein
MHGYGGAPLVSPVKRDGPGQGQGAPELGPVPNNLIRLPIGDHGYTRGKKERVKHEHSVGYGTEAFDIIDELTINREQYSVGPEDKCYNLSMLDFPSMCSIAIDAIRIRVQAGTRKVGRHPTIACCIANAVAIINTKDDVKETLESRDRFDFSDPDRDGDDITLISKWFNIFQIDLVMTGERQNIKLPLSTGTSLGELSTGLGLSIQTMAAICVMLTLSTQSCVNMDHRKAMSGQVEGFLKAVNKRVRGTRVLMVEFGL